MFSKNLIGVLPVACHMHRRATQASRFEGARVGGRVCANDRKTWAPLEPAAGQG